ncbi:uncharacterized protein LOC142976002 [Anticarsia gemmatalis]|uniref:uncharacterized protein LOC142976002 n=1 Tax=Anticarsia gemmatalis TaxID=129554 RepID=UPI003F75CAD9
MQLASYLLLAVMVYGGGGVTKPSGIEQFWTDDYKVFEQVYGKTSDRDIYGETLPAPVTFTNEKKKDASEKNERYLINYNDPDADQFDSYNLGDRYNNLLTKQSLKLFKKPATSAINFVSYSNFKPITQTNDPDTYNYLKHLEELNNEEKYDFPKSIGGFKPYLNYGVTNPEESDAYKSIQDILDAHEANKGNNYNTEEESSVKYLTYPKNKKKKPPRVYNDVTKPRCAGGRCRKRGNYRSRSRPYRRTPTVKTVVVI